MLKDYDLIMDKVAEAEELGPSIALPRWKSWQSWRAQEKNVMPRNATLLDVRKRGMPMNFNAEELMLMMLYNTGSRLGLMQELRLMQCYLMPDEFALGAVRGCGREAETYDRCGVCRAGISPGLIFAACGRRT